VLGAGDHAGHSVRDIERDRDRGATPEAHASHVHVDV
jgi:hypothetical protein